MAPPPPEFFRPNEFGIGVFANYDTSVGSGGGKLHAWGEAWISVTGSRGNMRVSGSTGPEQVFEEVVVHEQSPLLTGSLYVSLAQLAEAVWRRVSSRPTGLCDCRWMNSWPGVHLAPYAFVGFGGVLLGSADEQSFSQSFTITNNTAHQTRVVNVTGHRINNLRQHFGSDRVLGHVGGGLEYRFTPNIGIFAEVGYDFPDAYSISSTSVTS